MKTILVFLLMILVKIGHCQIDTIEKPSESKRLYPSLDLQYLYGIELNLKKELSKKMYTDIGIGAIGSVINRQTELLKIKYVIGYYIISRIHLYSGLKTGFYYNQDIDYYYHFIGTESGLFIDLTKIELGIKYTAGFDKTDFSNLISGANYLVLRIPLYKKNKF